ncbi:RING finger protein 145-like [Pterocles gutturalis]
MSRLEAVANVALRVPGLALLELLHRGEPPAIGLLLGGRGEPPALPPPALRAARGLGQVVCVVVLVLPVQSLVTLYLHLLAVLLLGAGHVAARDYIRRELELGFQDAVYSDTAALGRLATTLVGQICLCVLCSLLVRGRWPWLLVAQLLPVVARLCGVPPPTLPSIATFAASLSVLGGLCVLSPHLLVPVRLAVTACREVTQALELSRLVALAVSLWSQLAVPLLFLVFWLVLFSLRLSAFLTSPPGGPLAQHSLLFLLLSSVAECCGTPYSLLGLTFTVSYLALGVLNLCKFYLLGFGALRDGNATHRGVTEGVTLLLLALQTGLLDLQILQRTFLLSIILFIILTSTLQSMIEIADPIVLALAASRNRSPWKHFRGVSMCLFLLVFPSFLAYEVARFFHLDFWLLILVSSCMLTSLQVMGTLFIYVLLVAAPVQEAALERLDELVYGVSAVSRVLEFLVALCVVAFGAWESLFGEWSWVGASVIIVHSYFNVWLRARSGWRSFLLRRHAARKIRSLPCATRRQLRRHDDVCAICFQDMQVAVVTPCGHFFHAACLRKWLYVQDTCPMCHQQVTPVATEEDASIRTAPDHGDEDRGATASPAPAQPPEDGDSEAAQDDGTGDPRPPHPAQPHASAPQEPEAGAVPQPPGDPHPRVGDTQHPSPSPASPDPLASLEATTGDSGDPHSSHHPS